LRGESKSGRTVNIIGILFEVAIVGLEEGCAEVPGET